MNKVLVSLLFGSFILAGPGFAQTTPPVVAPAAPAAVTSAPSHHHEHSPELHKAIRKLRAAKADLDKAAHDYGGHKAKAIEAIDHAIQELQEAMDFAKSGK